MDNIRFKSVEKNGFYHIKDIELDFISQQKFFKKQAIYVCEKLNELNSEIDFYRNQALELKNMFNSKGGD